MERRSGGEAATYVVECFRTTALDPNPHVASFLHRDERTRLRTTAMLGLRRTISRVTQISAINYELKHLTEVRDLN